MAQERIHQLDYLKGIFILLMVLFHLALVEQTYPVLREAVYTFHMSAFLIISGYLANVDKQPVAFGKGLARIAVPYLLFEALYILMQFFLGWYLHTLVICTAVYWLVYRVLHLQGISGLALSGLLLYGLSLVIVGLDWSNVIYFLIGVFILRSGYSFLKVITPSFIAILPLAVLFAYRENYISGSLAGVAITVLVISLLLAVYPYCFKVVRDGLCYIGRNSLAIVVFSPIFTILTKKMAPYFSFDPSAITFAVIALVLIVACCLGCAWLSDRLHVSRFVFVRDRFYHPFMDCGDPVDNG